MSLSLKVPLCPGGAKTKAFQHVRTRQTNCDDNMRARAKGTFTNYVDNILPIIGHLPTPVDILLYFHKGKHLYTNDISSTTSTYLVLST